jgi:hypothetical protein
MSEMESPYRNEGSRQNRRSNYHEWRRAYSTGRVQLPLFRNGSGVDVNAFFLEIHNDSSGDGCDNLCSNLRCGAKAHSSTEAFEVRSVFGLWLVFE